MNKTKGFTLIEMLFVLQLIIIFGLFHLPYFNDDFQQSEIIIQEIINTIETVRLDAIFFQENQNLVFSNHSIIVNDNEVFTFKDINFLDNTQIYFNRKGHISKGCTILFELKNIEHKLVFNLGQGAFYIEKT